jgi:hypothetical protein
MMEAKRFEQDRLAHLGWFLHEIHPQQAARVLERGGEFVWRQAGMDAPIVGAV